MTATETIQKVLLVNGEFTPSEAAEVIGSLIDQKINFHKIKRLQQWEQDHYADTSTIENRIRELEKEKRAAKAFIRQAQEEGGSFTIHGELRICFTPSA
ncbi:MAG: hypothetical protein H6562_11580 [Lewinellaceae bacterium]|nr:hypothetical protein [Lewinella sp.]MCB9279550.1 hypothetical protein [Lewinellaceae bacterium]